MANENCFNPGRSTAPDRPFPLTIQEWKTAQLAGGGLDRLLALRVSEAKVNSDAWIALSSAEQIESQWRDLETAVASTASETSALALYGVPFAVKDNMDVAGFPTTVACPAFANGPVDRDATVVMQLRAAGAIVLGKTNLDQFATGLAGTRSPFGPVRNPFNSDYITGGSSSGSAAVVARGAVPFGLGTDTAGSGRVPAGFNNVVGLKPTRGAVSTTGIVPACRTLDCVSILALTLRDASTVLGIVEDYDAEDSFSRKRPLDAMSLTTRGRRVAVCANPDWSGESQQEAAYNVALEKAGSLGWTIEPRDFSLLFQLGRLLYDGPWVAERYAAIRDFITACPDEMDPSVKAVMLKAQQFSAADFFTAEYHRHDLARDISRVFGDYDAILVPTAPTFPTLEEIERDPIKRATHLGLYATFVNLLDWSALAIPAGFRADGLPFGITVMSTQWQEPKLVAMAQEWLSATSRVLGSTGVEMHERATGH